MEFIFSFPVLVIFLILVLSSIRQIDQYERGVLFTRGKFSSIKEPGWTIVWPIFQSMRKVDIRTKTVDVPEQETVTKDNIPIRMNAVIYYKVIDAAKSVLEVENFYYAVNQLAQVAMRNVVGQVTLDELLKNREDISKRIEEHVDTASGQWGIDVASVELKDIALPENLKRVLAKEAEAEREKRAVIIQASGEVIAAENISKAAKMLAESPGALHLRTLQSINDISSDQSNTTIWMIPIEVLKAVEGFNKMFGSKESK
jgi:regulator of protease activity HflC (stomatin/prohibitin superfamily)